MHELLKYDFKNVINLLLVLYQHRKKMHPYLNAWSASMRVNVKIE